MFFLIDVITLVNMMVKKIYLLFTSMIMLSSDMAANITASSPRIRP